MLQHLHYKIGIEVIASESNNLKSAFQQDLSVRLNVMWVGKATSSCVD